MPIKVCELFAGIGAQRKALTNLGIEHTCTISEIDKHAIASYTAIHGETENLGDIIKIDKLHDCDLLTYSFPCIDLSTAGKQMGMAKGTETRSSLLWEVERLLQCSPLPKVLLCENVKAITGEKFKKDLNKWITFLSSLGYTSSWTILNAKDFGVPQNRERFFMVSCLDGTHFQFPKGFKSSVCLKDILETNVDESYYLTAEQIKNFEAHKERHKAAGHGFGWSPQDGSDNAVALTNNPYRHGQNFIVDGVKIASDLNDPKRIEMTNRVYDGDGISPTLPSIHGGGHEIKITDTACTDTINIINGTKKGYLEGTDGDSVILIFPETNRLRGRVQKGIASTLMTDGNGLGVITKTPPAEEEAFTLTSSATEEQKIRCIGNLNNGSNTRGDVFDTDGLSPTLLACAGEKNNRVLIQPEGDWFDFTIPETGEHKAFYNPERKPLFIRKLTEREYWRLMGFTDEDFDKASKVSSRTQLYKQAGNSIVVPVLEAIFDCLYNKKQPKTKLLSQFAEGS